VDFVLRRGDDLVALEVRAGRKVLEADLRGPRAIAELPRVRREVEASALFGSARS
jgi:hypothetical protein